MTIYRLAAWGVALALLLTGCAKPQGLVQQKLDPKAPAAFGLPTSPGPDEPAPLTSRPPFGLYAQPPRADTFAKLSRGAISPDGRFRATMTDQGAWVARVDGAWLWQIALPAPPAPPPPQSAAPGPQPPAAPKPKAPTVVSLEWTPRNTLFLRDDSGAYHEAEPERARTALLPAALQGKELLTYSPDGKQVLYYINGKTGKQLWAAKADGTEPKFQGENVIGTWSKDGKLVVYKQAPAGTPGGPRDRDPFYVGPTSQ